MLTLEINRSFAGGFDSWNNDGSAEHGVDPGADQEGELVAWSCFELLTPFPRPSTAPPRDDRVQHGPILGLVEPGERLASDGRDGRRPDVHLRPPSGGRPPARLLAGRPRGPRDPREPRQAQREALHLAQRAASRPVREYVARIADPRPPAHAFAIISSAAQFLHLIFPHLVAETAYTLFYSYVGQHTSVGNYWNDPHQQPLYYNFSSFLPYINNEIKTVNSTRFRENLLKLDKMILIGGPDDGVITPWQSR